MTWPNENVLTPASLATDGNQDEGAKAQGLCEVKDSSHGCVPLYLAVAAMDGAREHLDSYALATDEPACCVVAAADFLDAAREVMTRPRDCPRWDGCSSPVCPLAVDGRRCGHIDGERVCGLLSELVKDGGESRLRGVIPAALVDTLIETAPKVAARLYRIRRVLERASRSSSCMAAGQRLSRCAGGANEDAEPAATNAPARHGCPIGLSVPELHDRMAMARA